MSAWQTIDTAPKDGTPILLADGKVVGSGGFGHIYPWGIVRKDGFYFDGAISPSMATHWMPLPPPPEK